MTRSARTLLVTTLISMSAELKDDDVSTRSYSGRAMYGARCIAIVGSGRDCMKAIARVINSKIQLLAAQELARVECEEVSEHNIEVEDVTELVEELMNYRQDSMGRDDIVVYWPDAEMSDEDEEKLNVDDEDEDE